jgi:hypothetical protein
MDSKELIGYLNDAAEACFKEQISGWGNLMGAAADHIAALEAENARLQQRADAAEGLVGAIEYLTDVIDEAGVYPMFKNQVDKATAALAAYKQAQGK